MKFKEFWQNGKGPIFFGPMSERGFTTKDGKYNLELSILCDHNDSMILSKEGEGYRAIVCSGTVLRYFFQEMMEQIIHYVDLIKELNLRPSVHLSLRPVGPAKDLFLAGLVIARRYSRLHYGGYLLDALEGPSRPIEDSPAVGLMLLTRSTALLIFSGVEASTLLMSTTSASRIWAPQACGQNPSEHRSGPNPQGKDRGVLDLSVHLPQNIGGPFGPQGSRPQTARQ